MIFGSQRFFLCPFGTGQNMIKLHAFSLFTLAGLRTEILNDKPYIVVPVVALIEGVRNGTLVLASEIADSLEGWNGRPVALRHPVDENGQYVTANVPTKLESDVIGVFLNAGFHGDRLTGEMWLDEHKIASLGGDALTTLDRLRAGEIVEVSVAYFCTSEPQTGEWQGQKFGEIVSNLLPDHVALLPDEVGACSVQDGCGAGVSTPNPLKQLREYTEVDFSTSVMVAFYLRSEDQQSLAPNPDDYPKGSEIVAFANLHITLAYLGDMQDAGLEFGRVAGQLASLVNGQPLVMAEIGGVGRFSGAEDGLDAIYLSVDSEQLCQFRAWLVGCLEWEDVEVSRPWGYTPHITLAYVPSTTRVVLPPVERRSLFFDRVSLSWGDQVVTFSLAGEVGPVKTLQEDTVNKTLQVKKSVKANEGASESDAKTTPTEEQAVVEQAVTEQAVASVVEQPAYVLPADLEELRKVMAELGGATGLLEAVRGVQAHSAQTKTAVIQSLVSSGRCAFTADELTAMSIATLEKLSASILPTSYVGASGSTLSANSEAGWHDYQTPTLAQ